MLTLSTPTATDVTSYARLDTPLGAAFLVANGGALAGLYLPDHGPVPPLQPHWVADDAPFAEVRTQLGGYFAGVRTRFDLELRPAGTAFQRQVWAALTTIPFGTTISYGELAARIGRPGAARAVGAANGANPISIIVACHRVIGADGGLTGYGWGVPQKSWLLAHERAR